MVDFGENCCRFRCQQTHGCAQGVGVQQQGSRVSGLLRFLGKKWGCEKMGVVVGGVNEGLKSFTKFCTLFSVIETI